MQITRMIVFKKAEMLSAYLLRQKKSGLSIGFVPTMGALHDGHLSLIAASKKESSITVCSIFVNPTQFNNPDDFERYPITLENDIEKLLSSGCDVLFLPVMGEVYPPGYVAKVYELGEIENQLEGKYRPGHFQGVCQVVDRLLAIVQPSELYLGQKDYQQCMVIEKLLLLTGRKESIYLSIVPTTREQDGLAMSSRNLRLSREQRVKAPALYRQLTHAKESLAVAEFEEINRHAMKALKQEGFSVDYFEIRDASTLLLPHNKQQKLVALVAAHLDGVRLIDNLPLS